MKAHDAFADKAVSTCAALHGFRIKNKPFFYDSKLIIFTVPVRHFPGSFKTFCMSTIYVNNTFVRHLNLIPKSTKVPFEVL
jgi:hypothetical protein